jgi:hypothetical protein
MLPTRLETIPSSPISQAFLNTSAPSAAIDSLNKTASAPFTMRSSSARRSSIGCRRNVLAVDLQQIKRGVSGGRRADLRAEGFEVAAPVGPKDNRLAIDEGVHKGKAANRLDNPRKPVAEIRPVTSPKLHPLAFFAGKQSVPIVLDLVRPARPRGRLGDEHRLSGTDETGGRRAPRTRRRDAPQHGGRFIDPRDGMRVVGETRCGRAGVAS